MNSTPTFPYGFPQLMFKEEGKNDTWRTIASNILKKFDDKHQKFIESLDERFV